LFLQEPLFPSRHEGEEQRLLHFVTLFAPNFFPIPPFPPHITLFPITSLMQVFVFCQSSFFGRRIYTCIADQVFSCLHFLLFFQLMKKL